MGSEKEEEKLSKMCATPIHTPTHTPSQILDPFLTRQELGYAN